MSAAPSTVPCVVCQRDLDAPPQGGTVVCPQCGAKNDVPAGGRATTPVCPACGEAVAANAPACPACGELLGSLTAEADDDAPPHVGGERSSSTALGSIVVDAAKDYAGAWWLLGAAVLAAMLLWIMLFVTEVFLGVGGIFVVDSVFGGSGDAVVWGFFLAYGLGALAALPINCAVPLGLANLHLAVARRTLPRGGRSGEGSKFAPLWRPRGRRRMLLCGGLSGLFTAGLVTAGMLLVDAFEPVARVGGSLPRELLETMYWVATTVPVLALWLLFWPLPFVIVDRPDLHLFRPLKACLTLPAGRWGGHLAVGMTTFVLLVLGTLPWGALLPIVGLLLAHVYDREASAVTEREGAPPLDPEGLL